MVSVRWCKLPPPQPLPSLIHTWRLIRASSFEPHHPLIECFFLMIQQEAYGVMMQGILNKLTLLLSDAVGYRHFSSDDETLCRFLL